MTNLSNSLPIASVQSVANGRQSWVALLLHLPPQTPFQSILPWLVGENGFLAQVPTQTLIIPCAQPLAINVADLEKVPNGRVIILIPAEICGDPQLEAHLRSLQSAGLRFMIDGCVASEVQPPIQVAAMLLRGKQSDLPSARETMRKLNGLHCVIDVVSPSRLAECKTANFSWFAGDFMLSPSTAKDEGTSRGRLLRLLALVERDADVRELETLLKQDMALSFHLLKLVNSAAFAPGAPITSFTQAINVLGRRQLQRWLQLLLYARSMEVGQANPLLPLAAMRASLMQGLTAANGGDATDQDQAFMVGMFSLLDLVIGTALSDVISALKLHANVVEALLHKTGPLGELLQIVIQASSGNATPDLQNLAISNDDYWQAMIEAYHWASVVMQEA